MIRISAGIKFVVASHLEVVLETSVLVSQEPVGSFVWLRVKVVRYGDEVVCDIGVPYPRILDEDAVFST